MEVRKMRVLRLKYGILRRDLGTVCGLSPQRISEIELNTGPEIEPETAEKLRHAFECVIAQRVHVCTELQRDYARSRSTLMERVEETSYEL